MDGLAFKKYISTTLKPYGFVRSGKNWGVVKDGLLTVVSIDKSPNCNGYFVDCGAKLTQERYSKYPEAGLLDIYEWFIFPADPFYKTDAYREALHTLPKGDSDHHWIARQFIDLDLFSDQEIQEAFQHNMEKRLLPMMDVNAIKEKLKSDVFYVQWSRHPERLHLYGVPEDIIRVNNPRYK